MENKRYNIETAPVTWKEIIYRFKDLIKQKRKKTIDSFNVIYSHNDGGSFYYEAPPEKCITREEMIERLKKDRC